MTDEQKNFISLMYANCVRYADDYGISQSCIPAIVGQAIVESNWGKSLLASKYFNYFGLKCGSSWTGKSVNLKTKEEYKAGQLTTIKDNFRVYSSIGLGIKGYFEFIKNKRYSNLKTATNPRQYLEYIKADGYATSSKYVNTVMKVVDSCVLPWLKQYDYKMNNIVKEVVLGMWGNGEERKQRLTKAGYDYKYVQSQVNMYLKGTE
jgi:flagellum-specific peptidoglycan hydrolase FlgJ